MGVKLYAECAKTKPPPTCRSAVRLAVGLDCACATPAAKNKAAIAAAAKVLRARSRLRGGDTRRGKAPLILCSLFCLRAYILPWMDSPFRRLSGLRQSITGKRPRQR